MLKWAKGSRSRSGSGSGGGARGSLAELRRASARLLRRRDSSSKTKSSVSSPPAPRSATQVDAEDLANASSSGLSSTAFEGVIKQATVRRMSTLRQTHDLSTVPDKRKHSQVTSDGQSDSSSVYMQLDKIPVAVTKRKVLEDISNQGYRQIIDHLQQEMAEPDNNESPPEHIDFTNLPPDHLLRPEPLRHHATSPQLAQHSGNKGEFSSEQLSRPIPPMGLHFSASPVKKTCHTSTGQHVHLMNCPPRPLTSIRSAFSGGKKSKNQKTVTFASPSDQKLPIVFEADIEGSLDHQNPDDGVSSGFVNVPCSRRGLCEVDLHALEDIDLIDEGQGRGQGKGQGRLSPEGDWQPSYVNLEDQEIAPVLLASSRPADESQDFWKPQTVHPLYDSLKMEENNQLQLELNLRYPLPQAPAARHSISNSSGSDTQDSGVAELAQQGPTSRAASASPFHVAPEVTPASVQSAFHTLPRTEKRSQCWNSSEYPPVYDNTDPHYLSATSSSIAPSMNSHFDQQWASDQLYCNMAPVDPRPLLPPRVSRRCTSLLDLSVRAEDAEYENVAVPPVVRPVALHSRTRSLRTSGDFSPLAQNLNFSQMSHVIKPRPVESLQRSEGTNRSSRRRELLEAERSLRLERLLLDSYNEGADNYEPSDWSTEAILSETVRDLDALSLSDETVVAPTLQRQQQQQQQQHSTTSVQQCCSKCSKCGLPEIPSGRPSAFMDLQPLTSSSASSTSSHAPRKAENNNSLNRSSSKLSAAENPLYMGYNDLSKLVDGVGSVEGVDYANSDYFSDGCETWNSHKALRARLESQRHTPTPPTPRTPPRSVKTPSSGRIWKQKGRTISTPNKKRHNQKKIRRKRSCYSQHSSVNSTSALLERSLLSIKNGAPTRKTVKKSKVKDILQGKGQLQLSIYLNSGLLTIHVISGRNLRSISGQPCNTYVKVALIPDRDERTFCRTSLIKDDNNPWFDQKFSFEFLSADLYKRLFISVWNRDIRRNRSEFLGCMSFSVSHVIRKDAVGWYRLLTSNTGRQQHFAVKKNAESGPVELDEDLVVVDDSEVADEDSAIFNPKVEDENSQIKGRTPYTISVKLKKGIQGFGFSITWTHPPRIERVEPGMPADCAGLRVGDYIIFVGNRNVVKMDEDQVLQLIQSSGDLLHLEVYRKKRSSSRAAPPSDRLLNHARNEILPAAGAAKKLTVAFNQSIGGGILV